MYTDAVYSTLLPAAVRKRIEEKHTEVEVSLAHCILTNFDIMTQRQLEEIEQQLVAIHSLVKASMTNVKCEV